MLQILIRNQAGELKSADLKECIESLGQTGSLGVQVFFSAAYEQYQDGPAELSINSIMLLN